MTEQLATPWVKLHLERQTEGSHMPPFIIGKLAKETATSFMLIDTLEEVETDLDWGVEINPAPSYISRTYVWRCEVLREDPTFQLQKASEEYGGGLG